MSDDRNPVLCQWIAEQIAASPNQRITFAQFMDWALFHPQHGYYITKAVKIGAGGDFVTAPHLGADFGELIAEQLAEMWQVLGAPQPFMLLEMGAGQGILAGDILRYLQKKYPDCFTAISYGIVERSQLLRSAQKRYLMDLPVQYLPVQWLTWETLEPDSIIGCCFSNELVDAFPVHQVIVEEGKLREVYVTVQGSSEQPKFTEVIGDLSTPDLATYFELIGVDITAYGDGYRTEVNLAVLDWVKTVANRLKRGYLLTIDYGYLAERYYSRGRSQGTLQAYYNHRFHNDPYINIGNQDLTAHVDFTALQKQGDRVGLGTLGFTQQGLFLMALGLGDRLAALATGEAIATGSTIQAVMQRREALHSLMNPMGLGNFGVLVQSKGLTEPERSHSLKGWQVAP